MFQSNDEYEQCPYDKSHTILKTRFHVHLGRCRKNHRNLQMVTCPFNVTHVLFKPELDWHVKQCPDRATFELQKYQEELAVTGNFGAPSTSAQAAAPVEQIPLHTEENWDDLPPSSTYNPQAYAANAPVLRTLQGESKSVKRKFRARERLRLLGIDDDGWNDN
ncbi:gametocyte-specific factor 1 homolog [Anastrepha ludens]|uniref:gametocyte-specific factor 1 homolog n=1 Tax=Anastrepha ludens TaxID=28586 RepID=UPI0023B1ABC1|nr:gametocyte-specific factor 1 homolog [Anastrepha ludens]